GLDYGDRFGCGQRLEDRLRDVATVDRQPEHSVTRFLEWPGVRVVGARFETGHVSVAQSSGILPECKRGKLVVVESEDHPLVTGTVAEHDERLPIAPRLLV